jgi:biopolymer transport protein TolR
VKLSRRALRMERHHKRSSRASLQLVSLMDIFTILVFFLLVNTSEVEVLPSTNAVDLPTSASELRPNETHILLITRSAILLNGEEIMSYKDAVDFDDRKLPELVDALRIAPKPLLTAENKDQPLEVTVMGDKNTPFKLLKKVMRSCSEAGYTRISLAVEQRPEDIPPIVVEAN